MALRLGALHDALIDPGNAEKAQKAAEEVAGYDTRLSKIEADVNLLKWMVGFNLTLSVAMLFLLFSILQRLPRS
jgi:hypothetical protein